MNMWKATETMQRDCMRVKGSKKKKEHEKKVNMCRCQKHVQFNQPYELFVYLCILYLQNIPNWKIPF